VFEKTFVNAYLFVGVRLIGVKQGKKTIVQSRGGDFLVALAKGIRSERGHLLARVSGDEKARRNRLGTLKNLFQP
jgi:hypothetical protein